jgi:DNA helicase-2/ATP-dependent DNA helicase PcrA
MTSVSPEPSGNPILARLNPQQREAVTHVQGPLLVIAGAGSGKTRVITHRIAYLIREGAPADSVLAITFTNKAAREMQKRVEALLGVRSQWVSTFHSFAARVLRRHLYRISPFNSSFTIYDEEDVQGLLKETVREVGLDPRQWSPRGFSAEISRLKNCGVKSPDELPPKSNYRDQVLHKVFSAYQKALEERNGVDFDDLLLLTVRLFEEHPDLLERYRDHFRHVLIDEYQDTNLVQYRIGRLLTEKSRNLCVTGDPDQSIYSWRGADLENLRRFEADYPEARTVTLEQNYRSTRRILRVANSVIRHDRNRKPKDLWSENPEGEPVRVRRYADGEAEALAVVREIERLRSEGMPGGDIAVFYRINALSREVERALIYAGIPYVVVGGVEFFQRREVKDVVAYLRILANPRDTESLRRIINVPARRIGRSTLDRIVERARAAGVPLLQAVLDVGERATLGEAPARALEAFASLYRSLAELPREAVAELIREVLRLTGYPRFLRDTEGEEAEERLRNVDELVNAAAEFDLTKPEGGLEGFLAEVALLSAVDRWEHRADRVSLMTLHSAKGLEFPAVFIIGIEGGLLPMVRASDLEEGRSPDISEERRLVYVGITRARARLFLSHVRERLRFGRLSPAIPSEFLAEIRDEESAPGLDLDDSTSSFIGGEPTGSFEPTEDAEEEREEQWEEGWDEDPFPPGARVLHESYGEGTVVRTSGLGARRRLTIRFDKAGEKQIVLGYVKIERL